MKNSGGRAEIEGGIEDGHSGRGREEDGFSARKEKPSVADGNKLGNKNTRGEGTPDPAELAVDACPLLAG